MRLSSHFGRWIKRITPGLALAATLLTSAANANPAWPPVVGPDTGHSPPLSPAEAVKTFSMPPGYHLELIAAEPLVRDPIAVDWDTHGRLWVVEMTGFLRDLKFPEPNLEPLCQIVVLEDTHHTGHMDKRTVFADHLVLPRSVKVLEGGVLVGEPPYIWYMHDQNGDLHMHTKEMITDTFGHREGNVENNANSLIWGLDNWLHTADNESDLRYKHGKFEFRRILARGEWGITEDDAGRMYLNSNESPVHVDYVPNSYYARNPSLLRTNGCYDLLGNFDDINNVWPARPNPGTNRAYQIGVDRPDGSIERYTSACGPLIYRGDALPADLYGNFFVAEPAANLITRSILTETDHGHDVEARKAYPRGDFVASTDERFRPVSLANAPDGTITVVDMYRGVIQERSDISQYLYNTIKKRNLEQPTEMGRIYRVVHETTAAKTPAPLLAGASNEDLIKALSDANAWRSNRAQQLLVEHDDRSVIPALSQLAASALDYRTRLHALWALDGIDGLKSEDILKALTDENPAVRVTGIKLAEPGLAEGRPGFKDAVLKLADDSDWSVTRQLAASLGALPLDQRSTAIAAILLRRGEDTVTMDAALSGLRGAEPATLDLVLKTEGAPRKASEPAIVMLAATIVRGGQDAAVQNLFQTVADANLPEWQRSALLRGAEVTLLRAKMPGPPAKKEGIAIDKTSPGGAYFFNDGHGIRPVRERPRNFSVLHLSKEPAAFTALTNASSPLSARASAVADKLGWPGKPGAESSLPALTPAEQARFDVGRVVYQNICQACHQPDGHGQERLAADLVGSDLALAPAEVTARILLNGKEGTIGLMPPIGATLSDDQVASVLTYVRREWGQPGSPVDPAVIKQVRAATLGRPKPWTNAELLALPEMKR